MDKKTILILSLILFFGSSKSFCEGMIPPVVKENFLSVSFEKEKQIIGTPENINGKVSHYFQAHINLNFNSKSNSHLSKGLQNVLKDVVETIYPQLLLIHQHDFILCVTKYHPSKLLSKIPLRIDVNVNIV